MFGLKLKIFMFFLAGYIFGCLVRHQKCQQEWDDRHPYSFTGREVTKDLAKRVLRAGATNPASILVKTTPTLENVITGIPPIKKYAKPSGKEEFRPKET